jgi:phosphohistidine phosphatase
LFEFVIRYSAPSLFTPLCLLAREANIPDIYPMKTLILVRHAKSSWEQAGISDFDRPLNERGKKDAPEMAKRLKEKGIELDHIVSSPAKRANKTAKYFAEEFNIKKDDIKLVDELYGATSPAFAHAVSNIEDKFDTVAVFSHNPGITEFASSLTNVRVDDMPTCAVFALQVDVDSWKDFTGADKKFLFFDYPKNPMP